MGDCVLPKKVLRLPRVYAKIDAFSFCTNAIVGECHALLLSRGRQASSIGRSLNRYVSFALRNRVSYGEKRSPIQVVPSR